MTVAGVGGRRANCALEKADFKLDAVSISPATTGALINRGFTTALEATANDMPTYVKLVKNYSTTNYENLLYLLSSNHRSIRLLVS